MAPPPPFTPNGIVTLTTDFGTRDAYVGAMKGVLLVIGPRLRLHDVAHDVEPQNVLHGGIVLRDACPYFPEGTVHLAVVDPGVGTARAPVVALAGGHAFVAPDNGLLAPVLERLGAPHAAHRIERGGALARHLPARPAATFDGRDLFAPAAAALAAGLVRPADVGPAHALLEHATLAPARQGDAVVGRVVYRDRFGNLVTDVRVADLAGLGPGPCAVQLPDGTRLVLRRTYGEVASGALLALVGSEGHVEIAVRDGSAHARLALEPGAAIRVVGTPA